MGKGRLDFTYRYSPDVVNNTIPLSKMIEKFEIKSLQARKDVLTDLMKEMLRNLLGSPCILVKSGEVAHRKRTSLVVIV